MSNAAMNEEKARLTYTQDEIKRVLSEEKIRFDRLPVLYAKDPRLLASMKSLIATKLNNMSTSEKRPYFARIDFKSNDSLTAEMLYIGKIGITSSNGDVLITDWRAPISSLYYDSNLGNATYLSPEGMVNGLLNLKRQIIIENGELISIFDVDAVSDDELLKPYLGANADNRLKNIVASIQSEQNSIIRANIAKDIIVQGVAGSGKTTVALHRIAYLVYNYSNVYKASQYMVIGPNKFFINYISNVLPDLDVGNAQQCTFEILASEYINEKFEIRDSSKRLIDIISGVNTPNYHSYKTSMDYKIALDKFIDNWQENFLSQNGLIVNGFQIMTKEEVMLRYRDTRKSNVASRLEMTVKRISNELKDNIKKRQEIKEYFNSLEKRYIDDSKKQIEIFKMMMDTNKQLGTGFSNALKRYLNISNIKIFDIYRSFIENIEKYSNYNNDNIKYLKKDTLANISKRCIEFEDVAALIYLKLCLKGNGNYKEFVHVVIDEAQDFGAFCFYVLKLLFNRSTFSIFGDLTQGIYSYRGINSWNNVSLSVFESKCEISKLEKSYRTTIEIMLAANLISKHLGLGEGKPVIRHGDPVNAIKLKDNESSDYIFNLINDYKNNGYSSIAIICKTPKESKKIYELMKQRNIVLELVSDDDENYKGGICVLPSHLAKGLEFDAVVVCNVDEDIFSSQNDLDMKLLYVAMTRALHKLVITYTNEISIPLRSLCDND